MEMPIKMNESKIEVAVIESVRNDLLQSLRENNLNYGEAREILKDIDSYLEEKAFF